MKLDHAGAVTGGMVERSGQVRQPAGFDKWKNDVECGPVYADDKYTWTRVRWLRGI